MVDSPNKEWIDVSVPLRPGMVHWPGDPPFESSHPHDLARGDSNTISLLSLGSHSGTHMDAPAHFILGGAGIDTMPPVASVGPARVLQVKDPESIKPAELATFGLRRGERVLFKTSSAGRLRQSDEFFQDFVYLTSESGRYLAERGVRTVGVDYLSVGGYHKDGADTHRALLGAGIWIIEGLDLSTIEPGRYDLMCLPLRIVGSDGAPARAFLRHR